MAIVKATRADVKKLVRLYKEAMNSLVNDFVREVSVDPVRLQSMVSQMFSRLAELDRRAEAWGRRYIQDIYMRANRAVKARLREAGFGRSFSVATRQRRATRFAAVNDRAVQALLLDPDTGFLSSLHAATGQIRQRMRQIQTMAKVMRRQQGIIDRVISRVGILEGHNLQRVKGEIVREILPKVDAAAARRAIERGFVTLADMPFVRTPSGRRLRLDRYAELVARTKTAQATGLATRNGILEVGGELVQISRNMSKDDDACNLYIGRVFALTADAAKEHGVPMVDELPGGGAPFHPNCTHLEIPFVMDLLDEDVIERGLSPPPDWALNVQWSEVQKLYKQRGGNAFGAQNNPNFAFAQNSGGRRRKLARAGRREEGPDGPGGEPAPPAPPESPRPVPPAAPEKPAVKAGPDPSKIKRTFSEGVTEEYRKTVEKAVRELPEKTLEALEQSGTEFRFGKLTSDTISAEEIERSFDGATFAAKKLDADSGGIGYFFPRDNPFVVVPEGARPAASAARDAIKLSDKELFNVVSHESGHALDWHFGTGTHWLSGVDQKFIKIADAEAAAFRTADPKGAKSIEYWLPSTPGDAPIGGEYVETFAEAHAVASGATRPFPDDLFAKHFKKTIEYMKELLEKK